jgi:hypothetical protein
MQRKELIIMAVIETCVYVDGELMAPALLPTLRAKSRLAFASAKYFPTFDIGYTHIYRITAWGLSSDKAERRAKPKVGRFYRKLNQVEGFSTIKLDKREDYVRSNQNYSVTYDIVYVIERTGSRTQRPDAPYPEYQHDLQKLTFTPETAAVLTRR